MKKIKFKYRDSLSNWEWKEQECIMSSVKECIELYGLGIDCDYQIISVEEELNMTKQELLNKVKERYIEFCNEEYNSNLTIEKLENEAELGLMFTTVGKNKEYDLQVSYDLENHLCVVELSREIPFGEWVTYTYELEQSLENFYQELETATFDMYYSYAHEVVENKFGLEDIEF